MKGAKKQWDKKMFGPIKRRPCKYYDARGLPTSEGPCPRTSFECHFIHPEDPEWVFPPSSASTSTGSFPAYHTNTNTSYAYNSWGPGKPRSRSPSRSRNGSSKSRSRSRNRHASLERRRTRSPPRRDRRHTFSSPTRNPRARTRSRDRTTRSRSGSRGRSRASTKFGPPLAPSISTTSKTTTTTFTTSTPATAAAAAAASPLDSSNAHLTFRAPGPLSASSSTTSFGGAAKPPTAPTWLSRQPTVMDRTRAAGDAARSSASAVGGASANAIGDASMSMSPTTRSAVSPTSSTKFQSFAGLANGTPANKPSLARIDTDVAGNTGEMSASSAPGTGAYTSASAPASARPATTSTTSPARADTPPAPAPLPPAPPFDGYPPDEHQQQMQMQQQMLSPSGRAPDADADPNGRVLSEEGYERRRKRWEERIGLLVEAVVAYKEHADVLAETVQLDGFARVPPDAGLEVSTVFASGSGSGIGSAGGSASGKEDAMVVGDGDEGVGAAAVMHDSAIRATIQAYEGALRAQEEDKKRIGERIADVLRALTSGEVGVHNPNPNLNGSSSTTTTTNASSSANPTGRASPSINDPPADDGLWPISYEQLEAEAKVEERYKEMARYVEELKSIAEELCRALGVDLGRLVGRGRRARERNLGLGGGSVKRKREGQAHALGEAQEGREGREGEREGQEGELGGAGRTVMGFGGEMSIPPRAPVVPRVRDDDDNEDAEAQSRASADYDQGPGTQTPTSAPHAKKRRKLGHNQHTSLPDGEQGVDDRAHSGGDEGEGEGAYHDPGNLGYFQETVDDKLVEQLVQLQGAVSELSNMVHQQEEATRDEIDTVFTDMFEQLKEELVREGVQGVQEDKEEGEGEEGEKEKENEKENGAGGREDGAEEDMVVDDDSQTNGGGGGQVDGQQAPPPQDQVLPIKAPQPLSIEGLNEELGNMKIEVDKATQDTNEMLDILSVWGGQMEQLGADYPVVADAFVKEVGRSEEIQQKYERLQAQQEEDSQRLAVLEQALKAHLSMPVTPPASPPMPNVDFILENIEEPIMDVLRDAAQPIVEEFRGGVQNKWESDVGKVYGGVYEKVKGTMNVLDLIQERVKSVNGVR